MSNNDTESTVIEGSDEYVTDSLDTDGAMAALLEKWEEGDSEDGESLSEGKSPITDSTEEVVEDKDDSDSKDDADDGKSDEDSEQEDSDEDSTDDDAGEDTQEQPVVNDDAKVTIEVNGESKEFSVGELKRLAGQEAALTQKSQEVAAQRKTYDTGMAVQKKALDYMYKRAVERFEPYKDMDFALAAQKYDVETYEALKEDAQQAHKDMQFFGEGLRQTLEIEQKQNAQAMAEAAKEAVKVLSDPKTGIEGFSAPLFGEMHKFAVDSGISRDTVDQLVDPVAWKLINMAMQFQKAKASQDSATPVKKKVKIIPTKGSPTTTEAKKSNKKARARASGNNIFDTLDSAADAFLESWGVSE